MDKITHTSGTFPLAVACQIREGWQGEKEENGIVRTTEFLSLGSFLFTILTDYSNFGSFNT